MDVILWAVLTVVFVIVEVVTIQLVSIWLAAGALITLILTCLFEIPLFLQIGIFVLSSAVLLAVTLPFLSKRITNTDYIATNSELDIGKSAIVIEEINRDLGTGRVTLNGVDWNAVSDNDSVISKDSIVTVKEVKGSKLIVTSARM